MNKQKVLASVREGTNFFKDIVSKNFTNNMFEHATNEVFTPIIQDILNNVDFGSEEISHIEVLNIIQDVKQILYNEFILITLHKIESILGSSMSIVLENEICDMLIPSNLSGNENLCKKVECEDTANELCDECKNGLINYLAWNYPKFLRDVIDDINKRIN